MNKKEDKGKQEEAFSSSAELAPRTPPALVPIVPAGVNNENQQTAIAIIKYKAELNQQFAQNAIET